MNNPVTGVFVLVASLYNSFYMAAWGFLGIIVSNLTAYALQLDRGRFCSWKLLRARHSSNRGTVKTGIERHGDTKSYRDTYYTCRLLSILKITGLNHFLSLLETTLMRLVRDNTGLAHQAGGPSGHRYFFF